MNIMIVDDEPIVCEGVRRLIERRLPAHRVAATAHSAREALDAILRARPDIAVLDIGMPDMSGLELSAILKERYPLVVVLFLSAHDEFSYAQASLANRVFDYVLKPVDEDRLIGALQRAAAEAAGRQAQQRQDELLDLYASGKLSSLYEIVTNRRFLMAVDAADSAQIASLSCQLFAQIRRQSADVGWQREVAQGLINALCNLVSEQLGPIADPLLAPTFERCRDTAELEAAFLAHVTRVARHLITYRAGNRKIHRVQQYIYKHYAEELSLQQLADVFQLSPAYLCELFKQQTGKNFRAFLVEVRMEHAIELLKQPHLPVASVANLVGYQDYAYFHKVFKKLTGMTPGDFRESFMWAEPVRGGERIP